MDDRIRKECLRENRYDKNPLLFAVQTGGSLREVEQLINQDEEWETEVVDLLVKNGADINRTTREDQLTILHYATKWGNVGICAHLISQGANVNARSGWGSTPIMHVGLKNTMAIVKLLVDHGADIKLVNNQGRELIDYMISRGVSEIQLDALIEMGVEWHTSNKSRDSVLHTAVISRNWNALRYFISKGADVNSQNTCGATALLADHGCITHITAARINDTNSEPGFLDFVDLLLDSGSDINTVDGGDRDLLVFAVMNGKGRLELKHLINRGALLNRAYHIKKSILHCAVMFNNVEAVSYFLSLGMDANQRDKNRRTLLHYSRAEHEEKFLEIAESFVNYGSDINALNPVGENFVLINLGMGLTNIGVEKLIELGCYWWSPSKRGETVLHKVTEDDDFELLAYFLSKRNEYTVDFI